MTRAKAVIGALFASALFAGAPLTGTAIAQDTAESPPPEVHLATPPVTTGAPLAPVDRAATPVAREMTLPKITAATVDWKAARGALSQLPAAQTPDAPTSADSKTSPDDDTRLTDLNSAAGAIYKDIARSSVPVLLPVNADALLRSKAGTPPDPEGDAAGFNLNFFLAGPAGYDAAFTLAGVAAGDVKNFARKEDPIVLISGFAMLYDLDPPVAASATPARNLEAQYPGIRRRLLESYVRYSFERFGVPYTASMLCFDGRAHARWVTCREADVILQRFLKTLQLAGGTPQPIAATAPNTIERPDAQSPDFTFAAPGQLIENSGFKGFGGRSDWTVYAKIRFPLAAPAYANSQSFLNWGNCDFTGATPHRQIKGAPYRCKVNDKPLVFDESAPENRSYPWRDNFCEHRRFYVGQCPGGEGHQGQDIRPTTCQLHNAGADRCDPFKDEVVAVRDGTILRVPKRESLYLLVNAPGEHVRFRYLHMHPAMLDADGLTSGREVKEGEVIGKVGNFDRIPKGTSYHLHFEIQVPTRDGWVFVNPYTTLIAAYERLIGGRGREFAEPEVAHAPSSDTISLAPAKTVEKLPGIVKQERSAKNRKAHRRGTRLSAKNIAKHAAQHAARTRLAEEEERHTVRRSGTGSGHDTHAITHHAAKARNAKAARQASTKETPGEKKASRRYRRAENSCKTDVPGGGGDRACGPRAAKHRSGANGV